VTPRDARLAAFASFPNRFRKAALAAAGRPLQAGEWGPTEVARHLIAVEDEVHVKRLRDLAEQTEPQWRWTEPGLAAGYDDASLDETVDAFTNARAATVRLFENLDDDGWARSGVHATYGRLDVDGLLKLATDHDAEHLAGLGAD
jgi:DinB superfamily